MNPAALIHLQSELEYGVVIRGNSIAVTTLNANEVPRVTVARWSSGLTVLFRSDLSPDERALYAAFDPDSLFSAFATPESFHVLGATRAVHCSWYVINRIPDQGEFPNVEQKNGRYVIERDGRIVAQAWSAQEDARAAEVEVETDPAWRGRGFGRQVVAAWAHHARRQGKTALYSHLTTNDASRALARSVGAWKYAETRELF